jgi:dipeptidyl aminopeptidase/acylaminoacyl peptidase
LTDRSYSLLIFLKATILDKIDYSLDASMDSFGFDSRDRDPNGLQADLIQTDLMQTPEPPTWASPPEPINQILDAPAFAKVLISPNQRWLIELERHSLLSIKLAKIGVAVAGFRLNPKTHAPSRHYTYHGMRIKAIPSLAAGSAEPSDPNALGGTFQTVELPEDAAIAFLRWSPDGNQLGFTHTTPTGLELWVVDLATALARRLTEPLLNGTYGTPYRWLSNQELVCKFVPSDRGEAPVKSPIPTAPIVQENLGKRTPSRTFINLLKDAHDEALFEHHVFSSLHSVALDGTQTQILASCLIDEAKPSPDGQYLLLTTIQRPYSHQFPAGFFPRRIQVIDRAGNLIYHLADLPLVDYRSTKFDAVRRGPRNVFWRSDRPATLYWTEALDDGEPTNPAEHRDALYILDAPFTADPQLLWRSQYRLRGIAWGNDNLALVGERWYDTRQYRLWQINPAQPETPPILYIERNYEDRYGDPGTVCMELGTYDRDVVRFSPDGTALYFSGRGASPAGVYPFLDLRPLDPAAAAQRLWQSQDPYYEAITELLPDDKHLITVRQTQTEPPNYFLGDRDNTQRIPLTDRVDLAPQFAGVQKRVVKYQRNDGVQLSANLYLPAGYDPERDGRLPTIFWIYPEEFKSRELAGQVTTAENTFSRPNGASVLFLLTQGYAVLSNPSVPVIGEGEVEPNDTYVAQLLASMEAAIDFVVQEGVSDRDRLAIGGHSYGAFTTANVLAHCDWFKAGIARSGAYNRTLTPFGFQGEQRTFWEASDTYVNMSPFTNAGKIAAPLLLIHGADDTNPGTHTMQTERFFDALKGLGATVRLVLLPLEDHSYHSREAVGHTLWEMVTWCDRYVKTIGQA